ncbi:MAG: transposase [Bacteroidia bacterium]|nr:transposase [Bacteroidia bacterium]
MFEKIKQHKSKSGPTDLCYNKVTTLVLKVKTFMQVFVDFEVEDINRFPNADKFASFIGLIPMSHSSGEKDKIGSITFRSHD